MKSYQMVAGALALGAVLALPSCEDMNKPLASGDGMLMAPSLPPGGFLRGGGFGGRSFHSVHVGRANDAQLALAKSRGSAALKSSTVKKQIEAKKVRYVAVPVKREKGQKSKGTTVMKVNAATGIPTGEVFEAADNGGAKNGDTIKLGGDPTLYFASTGGQL